MGWGEMKEICLSREAGLAEFDHPGSFYWSRMTTIYRKTRKHPCVYIRDAFREIFKLDY